jgi:hypothetical protein
MEEQGGGSASLLSSVFRALPPNPELILFVWSSEAFAFALRHIRGNVEMACEENPAQSACGRWALTNPYGARPHFQGKSVLKSLLGSGPHWIIINMAYYATVETVLDLFTVAAVINNNGTKFVSCNTPAYALQQLRQWRGELPPTVYWLPDVMPGDELPEPTKPLGLAPESGWWSTLLDGTRVSLAVDNDFDPDLYFLPDFQEPSDDDDDD